MPGPTYIRGALVKQALGYERLLPFELDCRVKEVLKLVKKLLPLGIPEDAEESTLDTQTRPPTFDLWRVPALF
jgi:beta-glucosidase